MATPQRRFVLARRRVGKPGLDQMRARRIVLVRRRQVVGPGRDVLGLRRSA